MYRVNSKCNSRTHDAFDVSSSSSHSHIRILSYSTSLISHSDISFIQLRLNTFLLPSCPQQTTSLVVSIVIVIPSPIPNLVQHVIVHVILMLLCLRSTLRERMGIAEKNNKNFHVNAMLSLSLFLSFYALITTFFRQNKTKHTERNDNESI